MCHIAESHKWNMWLSRIVEWFCHSSHNHFHHLKNFHTISKKTRIYEVVKMVASRESVGGPCWSVNEQNNYNPHLLGGLTCTQHKWQPRGDEDIMRPSRRTPVINRLRCQILACVLCIVRHIRMLNTYLNIRMEISYRDDTFNTTIAYDGISLVWTWMRGFGWKIQLTRTYDMAKKESK